MAGTRKLPEYEVLRRLFEGEGLTLRDIARFFPDLGDGDRKQLHKGGQRWTIKEIATHFGVSTEAVRKSLRAGGTDTNDGRMSHRDVLPWAVSPGIAAHHKQNGKYGAAIYRMLIRYSNRIQGRSVENEEYLDRFLSWMDGNNEWQVPLSVHYNREDGFTIRPRRPKDDGIISPPTQLRPV